MKFVCCKVLLLAVFGVVSCKPAKVLMEVKPIDLGGAGSRISQYNSDGVLTASSEPVEIMKDLKKELGRRPSLRQPIPNGRAVNAGPMARVVHLSDSIPKSSTTVPLELVTARKRAKWGFALSLLALVTGLIYIPYILVPAFLGGFFFSLSALRITRFYRTDYSRGLATAGLAIVLLMLGIVAAYFIIFAI